MNIFNKFIKDNLNKLNQNNKKIEDGNNEKFTEKEMKKIREMEIMKVGEYLRCKSKFTYPDKFIKKYVSLNMEEFKIQIVFK